MEVLELLKEFVAEYGTLKAFGPIGILAGAVLFLVRIYRTEFVQKLLPSKAKWNNFPAWAKLLVPFVLSFLTAYIGGLAAGPVAALVPAFLAAVTAIFGHHTTKFAGHKLDEKLAAGKLVYQPSAAREAVSLVLPLDPARLPKKPFVIK